jgi:CHAT domain-containing protein
VALSLQGDGSSDALMPEALMRLRLPGSLVVLNGCDSGRGFARPGLGLTGLAQAWMLGGASSVLGSLWPVPDDAAPIFLSFYQAVVDGVRPAEALRQAQMAALRAGGWRSDPSYWAAWVITTNK